MTKKSAEQVNLSLIPRCTPGRNQQQPRFRFNGAWTAEGMNTLGVVPSLSLSLPKGYWTSHRHANKVNFMFAFYLKNSLARKKEKEERIIGSLCCESTETQKIFSFSCLE